MTAPDLRSVAVYKMVKAETGNAWVPEFDYTALFHAWGLELWEQEPASVSYSVAIVEKNDGTICTVPPHLIRFH